MLQFLLNHIEYIALAVNIATFVAFLMKGDELGKTIYWLGTVFIVIGLLKMRG